MNLSLQNTAGSYEGGTGTRAVAACPMGWQRFLSSDTFRARF